MGYTREAIKGMTWAGGLRGVTRGLTLVRYAMLWRILSPDEFGLYSITFLVLALIEILTETGVNIYLVQVKENVDQYINTAWIVSIARGLLIAATILLSASFVSAFFKAPEVYELLLLLSIVPVIRGFINPAEITFQKDLQFHKEFWFRSSLFFVESFVAITLAFLTHSIASLVWALIVSASAEVLISFVVRKPRPSLTFNATQLKDMLYHGKWITAAGIFNYLYQNADNIVVGRILGTTALGFYDAAYKLAMVPITEVADIVSKVTLPVYAKISDDRPRLKRALIRTLMSVSILTTPIGIFFFLFPEFIIQLLLGPKALPAAPILKILAALGVIRAISGIPAALFFAIGKQKYVTLITLISFIFLAMMVVPLVETFGLIGAGYAALVASILPIPVVIYFVWKL